MHVLGIETSCDETAASVINEKAKILSSVVLSQDEIHSPFGGIVPELASRQHISSIGYVVHESLSRAKLSVSQIDMYGVTQGPGLIGSLLIGLSYAKSLAYYFRKPLIPVDHLESHVQSVFIENKKISFPAVALLVSGGHTSLFLLKKRLQFDLIAKTRDDAAGEALDKIAKFLGLGYPGGPIIDSLSEKGDPGKFEFSTPRMTDRSLDFSFSGLKTAALRLIQENSISKDHPLFFDYIASFEKAVIKALLSNLKHAVSVYQPKSVILCGGVARNRKLRKDFLEFSQKQKLLSFIPSPEFCTDNAAMVAVLALEKYKTKKSRTFSLDLNAYPIFSPRK